MAGTATAQALTQLGIKLAHQRHEAVCSVVMLLACGPGMHPICAYPCLINKRVTAQMAQRALESLRQRNPALVWKSARGEYAVDDAAMHRWFEQRVREGRWPPVDPQGQLAMDEDELSTANSQLEMPGRA